MSIKEELTIASEHNCNYIVELLSRATVFVFPEKEVEIVYKGGKDKAVWAVSQGGAYDWDRSKDKFVYKPFSEIKNGILRETIMNNIRFTLEEALEIVNNLEVKDPSIAECVLHTKRF